MRTALYGMMLAALLAAGCMPRPPFLWPEEESTPVEQAPQTIKHTPPVRADQVTPENAAEKARQLEAELENEGKTPLPQK